MKLKDYFSTVARVLHHHQTEGEVIDVLLNRDGLKKDETKEEFNRAAAEIRNALVENKKLLGVFGDPPDNPAPPEVVKEREIPLTKLELHMLKVRHDLRKFAPEKTPGQEPSMLKDNFEGALQRMLTTLTREMGIKDSAFGEVFGPNEAALYRKKFAPEPGTEPAPATGEWKLPPGSSEQERKDMEVILQRLRAAGKIQ